MVPARFSSNEGPNRHTLKRHHRILGEVSNHFVELPGIQGRAESLDVGL